MSRLTRDGTAEPVSRDQILRCKRGQGNIHFPCSTNHVQDWQPYPVDPYSCYMCDHTYIHGLEADPMVINAINGCRSWKREEDKGPMGMENEWKQAEAGCDNISTKPVSGGQILSRARGEGKKYFPCRAHHEQD